MTLKIFKNKKKEWCWHIKSSNGEIIAQGEGYKNKKDMMDAIDLLRNYFGPKEPYTVTSTLILPKEKWYRTIFRSIVYNGALALVGIAAGYGAIWIFITLIK